MTWGSRRGTSGGDVRVRWAPPVLAALAVLLLVLPGAQAGASPVLGAATASPGCTDPAVTSTSGGAFSASETLCRTYFDHGLVDERDFQLSVSETSGLRDGQVISVSWKGAHPTGGILSDQQLNTAAQQEYPVVIMECRGVDSSDVPASEQLAPETCWNSSVQERVPYVAPNIPAMWSLDAYNSLAQQAPDVNVPVPYPSTCAPVSGSQYWLPFVAMDGTTYDVGPSGCAGFPPEMLQNENAEEVPGDTTYASTALNGTGEDKFSVVTAETNSSLGCSPTIACSLVVVPIEGISCNANPTTTVVDGVTQSLAPEDVCENPGEFTPGSLNLGGNAYPPALSDTGTYWFSQSNWGRRISVPLNFATPANVCSQATGSALQFYGSELMVQATQQWNPYFCTNPKLFKVEQVQVGEPQAKTSLRQGDIEAAIQGAAPPVPSGASSYFTTPTVQAPIAVSGFAIAYVIDNSDGTPYTQLKLDPRLLAKLLTESYYGTNNVQSGDPGIAHNPQNIFDDPEFQALNPTFHAPIFVQPAPAATVFSILTQSDVIYSLTSYINADPQARAWLNGEPDPWGMTVNPAYRDIKLPLESWPLLDRSTDGPDYTPQGNPFCLGALGTGSAKEPDRPLIDNPQSSLQTVAYNLEYSIAASLIVCNNDPLTPTYLEYGPELLENRFLIGVVSLPAAEQLSLDTAALQTYAPDESGSGQFGAGRVFIAPSTSSLHAAADLFQPSQALGSWQFPYSDLHSRAADQGAYPGTMLMSADVPTSGLPASDAADYGEYLTFAATSGQTPGAGVGQLPAGYLPMTSSNGLAGEVAYTEAAAADVSGQDGKVPVPGTSATARSNETTSTTSLGPSNSGTGSGSGGNAGGLGEGSTGAETGAIANSPGSGAHGRPTSSGSAKGSGGRVKSSTAEIQPASAVGRTTGIASGLGGLALPLALLIALLGGGSSLVAWWRKGRVRAS